MNIHGIRRWEPVPDDGYGDNCHHWELADPVRVRLRMPKMVVCGKRRMVTHVKRKEQSRKMKVSDWIEYFCNMYEDDARFHVFRDEGDEETVKGPQLTQDLGVSAADVKQRYPDWNVVDYDASRRDLVSLFVTPPGGDTPADADDQKVRPVEDDPVNHPAHYTRGGIECIDAIKASMSPAEFRGFLKGNAMKYIWRYDAKGKPVEDLEKAMWYLTRLRNEIKP